YAMSLSLSKPTVDKTAPSAAWRASASSALFPIPGSPLRTRTLLVPLRASARNNLSTPISSSPPRSTDLIVFQRAFFRHCVSGPLRRGNLVGPHWLADKFQALGPTIVSCLMGARGGSRSPPCQAKEQALGSDARAPKQESRPRPTAGLPPCIGGGRSR